MANRITASILFFFKGVKHTPSLELDLDQHMRSGGRIPDLYPLLAEANGFDLYSYEFEMMQAEPIRFSSACGMAAEFINGETFDSEAFERAWHERQLLKKLQAIAREEMAIDNLEQHPQLKKALQRAWQLGNANQ